MTYTISPQMNGNGANVSKPAQSWLYASVQDFFSGFNWDDRPPEVRVATSTTPLEQAEPLSLTMSVGRFFAAINWDGTIAIAADPVLPIQQTSAKSKASEFTLDEFSDLF